MLFKPNSEQQDYCERKIEKDADGIKRDFFGGIIGTVEHLQKCYLGKPRCDHFVR